MAIMKGKEALMQLLHNEGAEYIFGLPGATEVLFLDALEDHPELKYILGLHEVIVVGMAEGYARMSGKAAVINLHTMAGLAAGMPMIQAAHDGGVPLVITAGTNDSRLLVQEPHLAGDLAGMARPFTKWSVEIVHASDIPIVMQRAFKVAMQPPTGPVFISLPMDIMDQDIDFEYVPNTPNFNELRPDLKAIATAVELLAKAKSPAILVESGVTRNNALSEVVELAELIGAPVYQAWMCDLNFPTGHPQYMGDLAVASPATREMFQSVDVLVAIGAPLFAPPPAYIPKPILTPKTKIVQIDNDPWQIGKNFPVASGISGHMKVSLAELNGALRNKMTAQARQAAKARAAAVTKEKEKVNKALLEQEKQERDRVPIAGSRFIQELSDCLKPGTVVLVDTLSYATYLRRYVNFTEPLSYMRNRGGPIGWAMPGAIGVKLAAPDRPVVALVGDGSAIWSIQSLWTAAHYNVPVTYLICADASYKTVKAQKTRSMGEKAKGRYLGLNFKEPRIDFCRLAEDMGVQGQKIERPEKLSSILKSALESGKPNLVEVCLADEF